MRKCRSCIEWRHGVSEPDYCAELVCKKSGDSPACKHYRSAIKMLLATLGVMGAALVAVYFIGRGLWEALCQS